MTATLLTNDPVESIPDPDVLGRELAASIRRSDLLRALIRVARRKQAYNRPDGGNGTPLQPTPGSPMPPAR